MAFDPALSAEVVRVYTPEVAAGIGRLMPFLDASFPDEPTDESELRYLIDSPDYEQLIAIHKRLGIVGAATMSIVRGAGFGKRGQLEDFVTLPHPEVKGAGSLLWGQGMMDWCREKGLTCFYLQTETWRDEERRNAIKFYERMGAKMLDDTVTFSAKVPALAV